MSKTINIEEWDKLSKKARKEVTKVIFTGTKKVSDVKDRPTLAFATMCKNEEHCIGVTLEHAAKHCDYFVIADNGSTDGTFDAVRNFFKETGLPGSWHVDPWDGYAINKTKMLSYVKDKCEYLLHLDADDRVSEDFYFTHSDAGYDFYLMTMLRGGSSWKATVIYKNDLVWRFLGTAHTIVKSNKEHMSQGDLTTRGHCNCDGIGSRAFDPRKYWYDGERLTKQFWDCLTDDPEGLLTRSAFYAGQSYMDYGGLSNKDGCSDKALQWYRLFLRFKDTWIEEQYEAQMRVGMLLMRLNGHENKFNEIKSEIDKAVELHPDRAEAYYYFGEYCCKQKKFDIAYQYLKKASQCNLEEMENKYNLFVMKACYGYHINDWLSVACYWTNRVEEGKALIMEILDSKELSKEFSHSLEHFNRNLKHFEDLEKRLEKENA
ncbi:MAG: glycosyltransferase family 2 protein [Flavobacteriales bacterium]|nr:glycosyltransferase family 2 protein [Flavobacteriales bacterium]